jgi:hypothetical protein
MPFTDLHPRLIDLAMIAFALMWAVCWVFP